MAAHPRFIGSLLLALALAGCAALLPRPAGPSPERVAERGADALERGDWDAAVADLLWVSTYHGDRGIARYALLTLGAAEVDPANPNRQLEAGIERLSEFRALSDNPRWLVPLAASLQRVALEVQAERERADRAERESRVAAERAAVARREASAAEAERGALQGRVAQLERELAQSRAEVATARREVARMRQALDG
jgi:hypothetical protein